MKSTRREATPGAVGWVAGTTTQPGASPCKALAAARQRQARSEDSWNSHPTRCEHRAKYSSWSDAKRHTAVSRNHNRKTRREHRQSAPARPRRAQGKLAQAQTAARAPNKALPYAGKLGQPKTRHEHPARLPGIVSDILTTSTVWHASGTPSTARLLAAYTSPGISALVRRM